MSDRKYRQHGYQDTGGERQRPSSEGGGERPARKDRDNTFGPRPLNMPGTQSVSRCAQCGTLLTTLSEPLGQCPIEKQTSTGAASRPNDARRAFDNLFKD